MSQQPFTSVNPYFFVPFILWLIVGGVCLSVWSHEELFIAINSRNSPWLDNLMFQITHIGEGVVIGIVLLALMLKRSFRNWWYFLTALLCSTIPALVTQFLKRSFGKPRPLSFFSDAGWIHNDSDWTKFYHNSFPSGHTTGTFSMFCLLACLLPKRYQPFGLLFLILAVLNGISRVYVAAHFFEDIYVGSIVGTGVALLLFSVMKHYLSAFFKTNDSVNTTGSL